MPNRQAIRRRLSGLLLPALAACLVANATIVSAQTPGRFLGKEEITVYGLGLKVEPAVQTVPKGFATIVSTFLQGSQDPGALPPFAPDAEVRATLRGPSFAQPVELAVRPNSPFQIPILTVPGTHTVENIRLVSGGEVVLYGSPEIARIEVIEKLLVTTVTARPLTADEIREKGIVFDRSNFQAYNFTAAFAIDDGSKIDIGFPVVLPTIVTPQNVNPTVATLEGIDVPLLRTIQTIIPDTLQIQARIPNLSVVGFSLTLDQGPQSQNFYVPPIPGVIVIPGDIGFLNQFFSVMLMVANVAPEGSNLVVTELTASIVLPPGQDNVVGSNDDPLAMAQRATGESPRIVPVTQPGPDGVLGNGDDVTALGPGQTGNAEFLVEGRREGTHIVEMELAGILNGLPVGPVPIRGRAAGAVLVRNPTFTLTFTHPDIVNVGEPYTLDVTVTNTSESPANIVSLNLFSNNISGARLDDEASKSIDFIAAGDSATVSFRLISNRTGKVTAATLDSGENVAGRFQLKTAVGELGVPLSPDSLVLPKEASALPEALRQAALGLLGRAWAVATAPPAALPKDLSRFSKQVVIDRAVETAEAGLRLSLGESLQDVSTSLLFDYLGSEYTQLASRVPQNDTTGLLELLQRDVKGFDLVRRLSVRGDIVADEIGKILSGPFASGAQALHQVIAEGATARPGHVSLFLSASGGPLPVDAYLTDGAGRRTGGLDGSKVIKDIPFSDLVTIRDGNGDVLGLMFYVAVAEVGDYTLHIARRGGTPADAPYDLSVAYPAGDNRLRFASFSAVGPTDLPSIEQDPADPTRIKVQLAGDGTPTVRTAPPQLVNDPPPSVLGVVQMPDADMAGCQSDPTRVYPIGRVVAVLFSEEVTAESVGDKLPPDAIVAFRPSNNRAMGVALQPGGRIAYVALREPVGPLVERTMTVEGVQDRSGQSMTAAQTLPIVPRVPDQGGQVSGRVLKADGTPGAFMAVRLFYEVNCGEDMPTVVGVAEEITDAEGRYHFDYVLAVPGLTVKLAALDTENQDLRIIRFRLARVRQHLNVDVVLLGRGTIRGRTLNEQGAPLADTVLRFTSSTDQSQYSTTTNANGEYVMAGVPVGTLLVEAVNVEAAAQTFVSEYIPFAGAVVDRDITLLDVDTTGVVIEYGKVTGRVLRADGVTAVANVPVVAWYQSNSQDGVSCPRPPGATTTPSQCAIAVATTDASGAFVFDSISAGELRLNTFDQVDLREGTVHITLAGNGTVDVSILIAGGFGTVNGIVLDASGNPVPDAVVGGGLSLVTVGPDGRFTLTDVPIGKRRLVAVSETLRATGEMTIDIVQEGETVNATIVLQPSGSIAGVVRSRDGVPQPGIKVWVFRECYDENEQPSICVLGEATSGASGEYRVDGLTAGQYTISAFRPDMKDGNVLPFAIRYNNQVLVQDIVFRGGFGSVSGRVLRACASEPCADTPLPAKVSISGDRLVVAGGKVGVRFEYVQNWNVVDNNFTTGEFAFSDVWVGPFTVRAAGQFSPEPIAVEGAITAPNQVVNLDVRLQPTSRITGTLYEPDGFTPVTGRQVALTFKSNAVVVFCSEDSQTGESTCETIPQGIQEAFAATDPETGRFSFPIVNAGPFTITVGNDPQGRIGEVQGAIRAGDEIDVAVRLLGRANVTVKVFRSDGFTPVPNATVELKQIEGAKAERQGVALDGTVVFEGGDALSEGQFVVKATDQNGFTGRASGRVVTDGVDVTVNVFLFDNTGSVAGQVVREDASGALVPVPNAEVILSIQQGPIAYTVSDASGNFTIPLVPTGPFTVEAFDPVTAGRGRASDTVVGGPVPTGVSVRLESLGSIRGTVVENGTFAPLKGWTVTLRTTTPSGRRLPDQVTQTGVDGSFSFPGASVGTFQLAASHRQVVGSASASGQMTGGGQLVEVPMIATIQRRVNGRVTGLVATGNGTPVPSAQVEVCAHPDPCRPTVAGSDGRFELGDVPLGRFTVRASAQITGNPSVGTTGGYVLFEGDTADVTITLLGLSTVEGTVFQIVNGSRVPAPNATVRLVGNPGSGCPGACQQSSDANGGFRFINVPAQTFTVSATGLSGQKGSVGGVLVPGETRTGLEIVLAPSVAFTGRAVLGTGDPAAGVVAELKITSGSVTTTLYDESDATGEFAFEAVGAGSYVLFLQDPIAGGIARRTGTINLAGPVSLGEVALDEAPPVVAASTPANGELGVSQTPEIRIMFSERINAGSLNASTFTVQGPDGQVSGTIDLLENDTVGRFRLLPGSGLLDQARYTVRVSGVVDLAGRSMAGDFTMAFTTLDLTPPAILETTPGTDASGVTIDTTIRIKYSEIVDPAKFSGSPITLTGPLGAVAGRVDFAFNNTVVIFTPERPLDEDTAYSVQVLRATDLAGRQQAADLAFQFTTTDRTPPVVVSLTPSNAGVVTEGATAQVSAVVTPSDVAVVDFFINDVFVFADRQAPFVLTLEAAAAFGGPGSRIKVSAVATDTSGNRGVAPVSTFLDVVADTPPSVTITQPAGEITAPGGQRIDVTVQAGDDLGISEIAYIARGATVVDAAARPVTPAATSRQESFSFIVPAGAVPGSTIAIEASVRDTRGQLTQATPVLVRVLDAVAPAAEVTGVSSGQRVRAGQEVTVVVVAQDPGLLTRVGLEVAGVLVRTEERVVDPARASVATTFSFTVPATAKSTDVVRLTPFGVDAANNRGTGPEVTLPVADEQVPTVTVRTASGSTDVPAGQTASIIVEALDDLALATLRLTATGPNGFSFDETKSVPPQGEASATFLLPIPSNLTAGDQVVLTARAVDASGNASAPVSATLTVRLVETVTLPASLFIEAGRDATLTVTLGAPAPAGGVRVDLVSRNAAIATVTPFVIVPAGASATDAMVSAVSGGTTQVDALIGGVTRATTTVTVAGGIVRGTVLRTAGEPPVLVPAGDVQVTVFHGGTPLVATTAADGTFQVAGVSGTGSQGRNFSVRAGDGALLGYLDGALNAANGFADVTVLLIAAGELEGVVNLPDGTNAGAGVKVELFETSAPTVVIATTFTDEAGSWSFPLVAPGPYRIDATGDGGNRGRVNATVVSGGTVQVPITFLGRGAVTGIVRSGAGVAVPNASVELHASSIFGAAPVETQTADGDGRFAFNGVFVGNVTVRARDQVTNQVGAVSGQLTAHDQVLDLTVSLAPYGNIRGTVRRADGVTVAPEANVNVRFSNNVTFNTVTDADGDYAFELVPFLPFTVTVFEPATRGRGTAQGVFNFSGETVTRDVTLLGQGALLVTVLDANGIPVNGATVSVQTTAFGLNDSLSGVTAELDGLPGRVLVDRLMAGEFTISATASGLGGSATGVLESGEIQQVTVQLEPQATIEGLVLDQDGQTFASGTVRVYRGGGVVATLTLENGRFSYTGKLGTYSLDARDTGGRRRALTGSFELTANGEVVTQDMTFVALGTVSGQVIPATVGGNVGAMPVQVRSLHPTFGGFFGATTDAAGFYSVSNVPVGAVTATASRPNEGLFGEASGMLAYVPPAPATLSLNIQLATNGVNLPTGLVDANGSSYTVAQNGGMSAGTGSVFNYGGLALDLVPAGGVEERFTGATFGTREDSNREIAVRQSLAGLNVTRKAFVPAGGYFARYLEVLTNPGATPVTVDVVVSSRLYGGQNIFCSFQCERTHFVYSTSSGDNVVDVASETPDRWVALGANGGNPWTQSGDGASLGFVFDGNGGTVRAGEASYLQLSPYVAPFERSLFKYGWKSVTVQPGETVTLMHFVSIQGGAFGAQAAAERLVGLPPEALAGLSAEEIGTIRNFAVPSTGTSEIEPLPAITGTVTGRVFEGDGATPVPGATVNFRSTDYGMFSRRLTATTNTAGEFSFSGGLGAPVPTAEFTMYAVYPVQQFWSPEVTGTFEAGETSATRDITFSDRAVLTGVVRRPNGTPVPGATVTLTGGISTTTDANGRYVLGGVVAGAARTLSGDIPRNDTGTRLRIVPLTVTLSPGEIRDDVLFVEPSGTVTGTLRDAGGNLQVNRLVQIRNTGGDFFEIGVFTDSSGRYTFNDVRTGSMTIQSTDPNNNLLVTKAVEVLPDALITADLEYSGNLTMTVRVTRASGAPLAGMTVSVSGTGFSQPAATTDANGVAAIPNVPAGRTATIVASHPALPAVIRTTTTAFVSGTLGEVTVALPGFGTVTGQVRRPGDGLPAGNNIKVDAVRTGLFTLTGTTGNEGDYTLGPIPVGQPFTLGAEHPTALINGVRPKYTVSDLVVTTDGQALTVDTTYPAIASLRLTVTENGAPLAGSQIREVIINSNGTVSTQLRGTTNASGVLLIPQIGAGRYTYRIMRGSTSTIAEIAIVDILNEHDGTEVAVNVEVKRFNISVRGTIFEADGVTPLLNSQRVELLRAGDRQVIGRVCVGGVTGCFPASTEGEGGFRFTQFDAIAGTINGGSGVSSGAGVIVLVRSPFQTSQMPTYEQHIVPNADGEYVVNITLPLRRATVSGRVLAADGETPVGAGAVSLHLVHDSSTSISSAPGVSADGTWTHGTGYVPVEGVRAKLWNVRGLPDGIVQAVSAPITTRDQVVSIDLVLPADKLFADITGRVVAGDGVTPIASSLVTFGFTADSCTSCSTFTEADGTFRFGLAVPPNGGLTVKAQSPHSSAVSLTEAFTITESGPMDAGTFVLPVSILKGRITSGGNPVEYPSVFVRNGSGQVTWADSDEQGEYLFIGLAPGTYTLTAQHPEAAVTAEREVVIESDETSLTIDLDLPAVGTVVVRVFDESGQQISLSDYEYANSRVVLTIPGGEFELYCGVDDEIYPDWDGCIFPGLPPGGYYAQAMLERCEENPDTGDYDNCVSSGFASASGVFADTSQTFYLDIRFDRLATVQVRTDPNWIPWNLVAPGQEVRITVQGLGANGPLGIDSGTFIMVPASFQAQTYQFKIPAGAFVVTAERAGNGPQGWEAIARLEGSAMPNQQVLADLSGGWGAQTLWAWMRGDDFWWYGIAEGGELGAADLEAGGTFIYANGFHRLNELRVNGAELQPARVATHRDIYADGVRVGQEVTSGPFGTPTPVHVTRRAYIPQAGGFIRLLDVYTNDTDIDVTVQIALRGHSLDATPGSVSLPGGWTPGYVIYDNSGVAGAPRASFGYSFHGHWGGPVQPEFSYEFGAENQPLVTATITIPARSRRAFMTFVVLRAPADIAAIESQIDQLGDPWMFEPALYGLTPADRQIIVNFSPMPIIGRP